MKRFFCITAGLLMLIFSSQFVFGEEIRYEAAGVGCWVPDEWVHEEDGSMIMVSDPGENVAVLYMVLEESELEEAETALVNELSALVSEIEQTDAEEEVEIGGMEGIMATYAGNIEEEPVELGVLLLHLPNNQYLLVVGMVAAEAYEEYEDVLIAMFDGIYKLDDYENYTDEEVY